MPTQVQVVLGAILREAEAKQLPCGVFGSFGWSGEAVRAKWMEMWMVCSAMASSLLWMLCGYGQGGDWVTCAGMRGHVHGNMGLLNWLISFPFCTPRRTRWISDSVRTLASSSPFRQSASVQFRPTAKVWQGHHDPTSGSHRRCTLDC